MPFADENGADDGDVATKADTIKVPYCTKDTVYWFRRLEIQMQIRKIKSQFWKRVVLEANLPAEVNETIKDLLIKEESESATVYKDCKERILKIFGPKPEQDVALAMGLVMTGLPSQAGKRVKELICKRNFDCCCPAIVGKIWRDLLPRDVRTAVASYDLSKDWDAALDRADDVYNATRAGQGAQAVAAVDLNETAPALQHDVAAVNRQRAGQARSSNNNNSNNKPQKKKFDLSNRDTWGRFHRDFNGQKPPAKICFQHYRYGKQAHFCRNEEECPWKDFTKKPTQ